MQKGDYRHRANGDSHSRSAQAVTYLPVYATVQLLSSLIRYCILKNLIDKVTLTTLLKSAGPFAVWSILWGHLSLF